MNDGITNYTFSGNDVCIIYLFASVFLFGLVLVFFVCLFCFVRELWLQEWMLLIFSGIERSCPDRVFDPTSRSRGICNIHLKF